MRGDDGAPLALGRQAWADSQRPQTERAGWVPGAAGIRPPPQLDTPAGEHWLVTGGTGFIGRRLVEALAAPAVTVLTRRKAGAALPGRVRLVESLAALDGGERFDVIVHLAGEPIAGGLWTPDRRERIRASRPEVAVELLALMDRLRAKPRVWINASAVGWYGLRGDERLDEAAAPKDCFSHQVCAAAEAAAEPASAHGARVAQLRIGPALAAHGGLLAPLLAPFKLGLGGPLGSGRQWLSWIELDDLVRLIAHVAADDALVGPINATAPCPVDNATFSQALAKALHRPAFLRVPRTPLTWLLGDLARELLFAGQRVAPARALASGFAFRHPTLPEALAHALS